MKRLKVIAVILLMTALVTACSSSGSGTADTTAAPETAEDSSSSEAEEGKAEETEPETAAEADDNEVYQMLQGVIEDITDDGSAFSLQCDDGVTREITVSDICDVETEIDTGVQIAIACIGKISDDLSGVKLVVLLPEQEEWTFITRTGVTTSNAMSAFAIETDDGENIQFLKDNCPIETGALSNDDGDRVTVTYVNSMDTNFPVEVKAAE